MSATEHDAGHDPLRQEVDKVSSGTIIAVGVTALVLFAAGIVWAVQIQRETTKIIFEQTGKEQSGSVRSFTPDQVPVGKQDEIGMVYQASFDSNFAAKLKEEQLDHVKSVGWVDQASKKVHIPIDVAMKEYLADIEKTGSKL